MDAKTKLPWEIPDSGFVRLLMQFQNERPKSFDVNSNEGTTNTYIISRYIIYTYASINFMLFIFSTEFRT